MKSYFVHGTLGDTFIACCKLYKMTDKYNIYHKTEHKYWYSQIEEIYSLVDDKINNLEFTEDIREDLEEITSDCHEGDMEFFPLFNIDSKDKIEEEYHILQPHSGKPMEGFNSKKIDKNVINNIIQTNKDKNFVLVGTDEKYLDIENCVNLIGKTNIKDLMYLVSNSSGYLGPEGLISFMSLSQKKQSFIFYVLEEAVNKRIISTPWEQYAQLLKVNI